MTSDKEIAISPRGYTAKNYKGVDSNKKQRIQNRNRAFMVTLIISANAFLFIPLLIKPVSDPPKF